MLSIRAPHTLGSPKKTKVSKDLSLRLGVFLERGLVKGVPTTWQLLLGQLEMAPYVVLPDAGDKARYNGARLASPLLRTPLIVSHSGATTGGTDPAFSSDSTWVVFESTASDVLPPGADTNTCDGCGTPGCCSRRRMKTGRR